MEMNARLSADLYVNNSSNSGTTYLLLTLPLIYLTVLLDTFVLRVCACARARARACVHVRGRLHMSASVFVFCVCT